MTGCSIRPVLLVVLVALLCPAFLSCGGGATADTPSPLRILAVETFLADMAQNVAGERLQVQSLLPIGADPHSYQPTPADLTRVAECDVLIVNGAGFEGFLASVLRNVGGEHLVITASAGLAARAPTAGEVPDEDHEVDPHYWLNPLNAVRYVENIRDGLSRADPAGAEIYAANAAAYVGRLRELDRWVALQVEAIPPERRVLVTNHESLGYFADRYGFRILGTIVPSVSSEAAPSAEQLASLVDAIRAVGARAIFLETGSNPRLAQQVARETGVTVVVELYTHSTSEPGGPAPTYIEMIRYNTQAIVAALK